MLGRKMNIGAFLITALLVCRSLTALPIGNPADPILFSCGVGEYCDFNYNLGSYCHLPLDNFTLRIGYYGDFVSNQHMRFDSSERSGIVDQTEIYTNAGSLTVNYRCADFFATFGATNIEILGFNGTSSTPGFERNSSKVVTTTDFSWSLGTRAVFYQCGCFVFGGELQYFYTRPKVNFVRSGNEDFHVNNERVKYQEWQFGFAAAYRMAFPTDCSSFGLTPYTGLRFGYSWISVDEVEIPSPNFSGNVARIDPAKCDRCWGYAIGLTLDICEMLGWTIEWRFVGERAFFVGGQICF